MAARALSRKQERHLVLDYLLGFPMKQIEQWYDVPRQSIYRTLRRLDVDTDRKAMPIKTV